MVAPRSSRAARSRSKPPAQRHWWFVAGIAALLGAIGIISWMSTRRDRAAELADRQRNLLATTVRLRTKDVDAFIREADRMTMQEANVVRAALAAEWRGLRHATIDHYFDAPETDRPKLLDDDIVRLQNYHRLLAALDPMDRPGGRVRPPRRAGPRADSEKETEADRMRRELGELYDAARAARARERGITLPTSR